MEMITLAVSVISSTLLIGAATIFCYGVVRSSKKPVETSPEQLELVRAQMELLMGEAVEAFQTRLRELAQQNAELTQIGAWLRQLEKDGDIDLDALGKDTAKRVKALRIKKAEAAVAVAESSLAVVRGEVSKYVELQVRYGSYTSGIKRLKELEQHETQYLEAARARFDTLVKK